MRLEISGSCNRCGDCCKLMNKRHLMLDLGTGYCAFLLEDGDCAIHEVAARGRMDPAIQEYWEQNCRDFPWYLERQDPERVLRAIERMGWPTERCGFKVEVLDG